MTHPITRRQLLKSGLATSLARLGVGMFISGFPLAALCAKPKSNRYMLACNRLGLATDFAVTDTGFYTGDTTGRSGGNGTTLFAYAFSRTKCTTTWAANNGMFLWSNWVNTLNGMLSVPFTLLIQKAQVRDTYGNIIATLTWRGNGSVTLAASGAAGSYVWNDPIQTTLAANTTYYCDVWYQPTLHGSYPGLPPAVLAGEAGKESATDLSGLGPYNSGNPAAINGRFGPQRFIAQGWNGSPVVQCFGTSISDYTNMSAQLATARGDATWPGMAFGDSTTGGGSWNYHLAARYSSIMASVSSDNSGLGTIGVASFLAAADALVQNQPTFTHVFCEQGRNDTSTSSTLASWQTSFNTLHTKITSLFGAIKFWQATISPYTTANSYTLWTTQADQVSYTGAVSAAVLKTINDWIIAGCGGKADGCFDTAASVRDPTNYANWATPSFSTTLMTAVAAATTNIAVLKDSPPLGIGLVFQPGNPTNADNMQNRPYMPAAIFGSAGNYSVTLNGGRTSVAAPASASAASRIKLAHSAGITVIGALTADGLHPNHYAGTGLMAPVLINGKNAMRYS